MIDEERWAYLNDWEEQTKKEKNKDLHVLRSFSLCLYSLMRYLADLSCPPKT